MPIPFLSRFVNSKDAVRQEDITVVSGLPRSGTSMMMKMLEAGGVAIMTDNQRAADENNPKGYYEYERVKQLKKGDYAWLNDAHGKAVKIISALLEQLPDEHTYKIIFMRRNMNEILASQRQMLIRLGEATDKVSDEKLADLYQKHLDKVEAWLGQQTHMKVLFVSYNDILADPQANLIRINQFFGNRLDMQRMMPVVDKGLYRERRPTP